MTKKELLNEIIMYSTKINTITSTSIKQEHRDILNECYHRLPFFYAQLSKLNKFDYCEDSNRIMHGISPYMDKKDMQEAKSKIRYRFHGLISKLKILE